MVPTGPVAARTVARAPPSVTCRAAESTAAVAVVLHPPESSITEARIGPKNISPIFFQEEFASGDVRTTDKEGRILELVDSPRKHCTVDERNNILWCDGRVLQQMVNAGIDRHHTVEGTRMRIGIKLKQNFWMGHEQWFLITLPSTTGNRIVAIRPFIGQRVSVVRIFSLWVGAATEF